ncbi:amino acid adenylation domain-containing protein [Microcoleus sp. FACHB-SPT15]|nr:amino acid adenylation domain-containing protein [Microcoleus sp. FACHB-SPT15]
MFCMHQFFESQVELAPHAIALVQGNEQWTYQELNAKANRLANYLKKQSVAPEMRVGICAERSIEMVVGILGILKAGGTYVPLDLAYPKERIAFILEDTQVSLLLTQRPLVEGFLQQGVPVICLDKEWETIAQESQETPLNEVKPQNLAYVMYTSGSTGKPKGVQISHTNVSHYIEAINKVLQVQPDDVYLHTASFSFSSSIRQLIVPLSQGARVVLATREQTQNPLTLFELIQKQGVTIIDTVESVWRYGLQALENLDQNSQDRLLSSKLRLLVFSGGLLHCQLYKKLRCKLKNQPRIVNIYGQTETIGVCAYPIPTEFDREQGYVPVGYPLCEIQVYILDSELQRVPVGEPGELHVAGASVTCGYLNLDQLNVEKFIDNPFVEEQPIALGGGASAIASESSARLYKTGDLARYLPNGTLEILGRVDFQVKLRGMRVELGEIESVLEQHPTIRQSVVTAREDKPGDKRLVAYIVPKLPSADISKTALIKELRIVLEEKLPSYMVPSAFVLLDKLPLTPNGKLDRLSLPAPTQDDAERKETFVTAQNDLELQLTQIWEKVLGIENISIKDNFFELGGHSLLAAQLLAQVEQIVGKNLPLAILLQAPTVEELANLLTKEEESTVSWSALVPIQPAGSKPPLFCVHAVMGNVLNFWNLARYLGSDQPVYGLQARGLDGKQAPLSRVEDMATEYLKEVRLIQPQGPYYLSGYSFGGAVAFEMAQQLVAQGEKIALLVLFDAGSVVAFKKLSVKERLSNHWQSFSRLGPNYILNKVTTRIKTIQTSMREKLQHKLSQNRGLVLANAEPIPTLPTIEQTNRLALKNYKPNVYPGLGILFRANTWAEEEEWFRDPLLGWGDRFEQGLEVYDVPGTHFTVLDEPHVQVLIKELKVCLEKAQSAHSVQAKPIINSSERPINLFEYESLASQYLSEMALGYYTGGAWDEVTLRDNREAFERFKLSPRMLVDVSHRDLSTQILGQAVRMPILIAPTAFQCLAHPEGEMATRRAAAEMGVAMVLSTMSTKSLEEVASVPMSTPQWFQLYIHHDRALTRALVERAEAAGFSALCLTVDAQLAGSREKSRRNPFTLPSGMQMANLVTMKGREIPATVEDSRLLTYFTQQLDQSLTWQDLEWLQSITTMPVVVKGILRGDDALRAVEHGVKAVIVSNHGGRQLDGAIATIDALPEVVAAVGDKAEVLVDGGIRRGTDVLKALSLGAKAVLLGRPVLWGLAVGGEAGVHHVLELLRDELNLAMALSGCATLQDIDASLVKRL